jgi:hypothetical protein
MLQSRPALRARNFLASGAWLNAQRATTYPLIFLVIEALVALGTVLTGHGLLDVLGKPIGTDFASFWTASDAVLAGLAAEAYDPALHEAAETRLFGTDVGSFAWFYPPVALLLFAPLALLPYGSALVAWLAITGAGYVATVRRFVPRPRTLVPILGFTAVFTNIGHGQNAFLSTAILGLGLLLSERRPLVAGAILGCLGYKPQLLPMLGVVVLARWHWRLAVGAALSAAALSVLATLLFGLEIWADFRAVVPLAQASLEQGLVGFDKMQSVFSAVRLLGGGIACAYLLQGAVSTGAAVALWQIWRSAAALPLRAGAVAAAVLLGTPFILDYDLVLLALPIAALAADGLASGFRPYEKTVLAAAWVMPALARHAQTQLHLPLAPETVLLLLALIWRRSRARQSTAAVN